MKDNVVSILRDYTVDNFNVQLNPLESEIERCAIWIMASLDRSQFAGIATHYFTDVKDMILKGNAQLWATESGCIVTFVSHFPQSSILTAWLAGGNFEHVMAEHEKAIDDFGISQGCVALYVMGRKGWKRKLKPRGYVEHAVAICKKL